MEGADILDALLIRIGPGLRMRLVMDRVARLLSAPDTRLDVQWTTPDQLLEGTRRLQRTIRLSAGSVTLLCLVLGGSHADEPDARQRPRPGAGNRPAPRARRDTARCGRPVCGRGLLYHRRGIHSWPCRSRRSWPLPTRTAKRSAEARDFDFSIAGRCLYLPRRCVFVLAGARGGSNRARGGAAERVIRTGCICQILLA